jgi:small subunit ribosomal protein S11e
MDVQTERAYQKQAPIFENKKRVLGQRIKANEIRYVKGVGMGFKTPREVSHNAEASLHRTFGGEKDSSPLSIPGA